MKQKYFKPQIITEELIKADVLCASDVIDDRLENRTVEDVWDTLASFDFIDLL